jgi:tetratricopeptide (TPR) repeat protein
MEEILHQAEQLEKGYDWVEAAGLYEEALKLLPEDDFLRKAEIHEHLGYAFYRAAFQAETNEEFRSRLHQSTVAYGEAIEFYGRQKESMKTARTFRCNAMIAYLGYWLTPETKEKKKLIDECWRLTKNALETFEARNAIEYGKTFNELSASVEIGFYFCETCETREKMIREAANYGEHAISSLSSLGDHYELARAYAKTAACTSVVGYYFANLEEKTKYLQKAKDYWFKAKETSEETAFTELPSLLFGCGPSGYWPDGTDDALNNFEKALELSRKTRDKFIIGKALDMLAYQGVWRANATEDPDEITALLKKALQHAEDTKDQYLTLSFTSPRGGTNWAEGTSLYYYLGLANRETDLNAKRELLRKGLEAAPDILKLAEKSGYSETMSEMHGIFVTLLIESAGIETNLEEKKRLLETALVHSDEAIAIIERIEPLAYWNLGMNLAGAVRSRYWLADLAKDPETKKNMLQRVLLDSEEALRICMKQVTSFYSVEDVTPMLRIAGNWEFNNGKCCLSLYELTSDREYLRKAIEAFQRAIETRQKTSQTSRLAESYWKVAQTYDALGEYLKAADHFDNASKNYRKAEEKIPQLKSFYEDYALYMRAWEEIERARNHHARQEYGSAEEHFQRAADIHKSIKKWSYLSSNYSAWARVEEAEELSRKEQCEEALNAFDQAAGLFNETKTSIQKELGKIEDPDEKHTAASLMKATETRLEYCRGRITIEEAKILDKKGDHYSSSEKYGAAAETFEKIGQASDSEEERKEFKLIITLSKAWQKTTLAEARSSSALYSDASELFEQAEDLTPSEKTKMLILGHSRFCKALGAGARFIDSRSKNMYIEAIECLESAATYYLKAGFPKSSDYSEATKLLFDAYAYMDNAARESDPEKKAKLYTMAEKVLQTSAGSFTRAEHPEKSEQVLELLEKARKERELAESLNEVLHAPSIVSTTSSFTTPTPTHEQAVGSERFEHADVQANLIVHQKELKVGEDLNVEIEVVNAGRGPAVLIKLSDIVPEGFELVDKPEIYRVEDSYLNMKGKRLDALKPEEIKITLKPKNQGVFQLKPRISYLDENSKYRYYDTEPVSVVVKELGIKGWLKGEK